MVQPTVIIGFIRKNGWKWRCSKYWKLSAPAKFPCQQGNKQGKSLKIANSFASTFNICFTNFATKEKLTGKLVFWNREKNSWKRKNAQQRRKHFYHLLHFEYLAVIRWYNGRKRINFEFLEPYAIHCQRQKIIKMNKLRAIITKLIFVVFPLIPFQVLGEGSLEHNEEIFESVCRDYEIIGLSTKCENKLYQAEVPLIYKHELPFAQPIVSNAATPNVFSQSCSFGSNKEIICDLFQ